MVYPRVCGATTRIIISSTVPPNLSPRVRGNLTALVPTSAYIRSIPACAGQPMPFLYLIPYRGSIHACAGPLERDQEHLRSIPACAGQPTQDRALVPLANDSVYPRVCGATRVGDGSDWRVCLAGLSPRVRGNHIRSCSVQRNYVGGLSPRVRGNRTRAASSVDQRIARSIPACAGQPLMTGMASTPTTQGLSPRVRGNLE